MNAYYSFEIWDWQAFCVKGQILSISDFEGHMVSVHMTCKKKNYFISLCYNLNAASATVKERGMAVRQ